MTTIPVDHHQAQVVPGSLPQVAIIIVNWNSKDFVQRCVQSIFQHSHGTPVEIVVVDNGSFDGCDQMLAHEFPAVVFLQSTENLGFARANNFAAAHSSAPFLLFLNPDTEFIEDSIRILLEKVQLSPSSGAVGCRILNGDRTLQTSCVQSFPTITNQILDSDFLRERFPRSGLWGTAALHSKNPECVEVEVISGACILVKREVFDRVGGFSENYFMYAEDLDLCLKIRQAGYKVSYVPETSIVHFGGGSTSQDKNASSDVMMRESVYRLFKANRGWASAACYRAAMGGSALVRILLILPLLMFSGARTTPRRTRSLRKWFAILRWSLGFESRTLLKAPVKGKPDGLRAPATSDLLGSP